LDVDRELPQRYRHAGHLQSTTGRAHAPEQEETLDTHIDDLPHFPFTKTDPLIVTLRNPVDQHVVSED
jgi:hypothetical protein